MAGKKKILHLIQSLNNGGCENMLLRTLPLLGDFEHTIITLKEPGELAPKFSTLDITIIPAHCDGFTDITGIFRLRRLISEVKPDIILTYLFHADMLGRLALFGTTKAPIIPFLRTTYNDSRYWIARAAEWLTKPLVQRYLANSEAVKDFYVRKLGVSANQITVIPNGIDTDFFDCLAPDPILRDSIGISPDDFVIICVANLHPNKGHHYLLEAFESSFSKNPTIKLLIVGDGTERKNLERQIKDYRSKNGVFFLGRRTDIPQLLKVSDCFVLPTLFEGMSNAIMEAMAASLPVITTDIPENRELIRAGETGILVPQKDSRAIVEAIERLLSDPEKFETLGKNSKHNIRERFGIKVVISKLNQFFKSL